jgi:perosamine synthetase
MYNNSLSARIINALHSVCGDAPVSLHEPLFKGNEWKYVKNCLDSTFVSSVGEYVNRFEEDLAKYTGSKYAVAVVNGTAALHIALILAGVKPEDEVLIPTLTFVATANAVCYCGAIPHFVDIKEQNLGIDPTSLRTWLENISEQHNGICINKQTGRAIRALLPMHAFGHPCEMYELQKIAIDYNLILVEDAAESLGSWYGNKHTGTIGEIGILSFNGNKIITTGGGGAILTDNEELARKAKHLTTTAKKPHKWAFEHDEIGFNYRMPNINAALGCAQLEEISDFIISKRKLFMRYNHAFSEIPFLRLIAEPIGCESNYWLQTLLLDESIENHRDAIIEATNNAGFQTRPSWILMHNLKQFLNCPRAPLTVAESVSKRLINLPSSASLI